MITCSLDRDRANEIVNEFLVSRERVLMTILVSRSGHADCRIISSLCLPQLGRPFATHSLVYPSEFRVNAYDEIARPSTLSINRSFLFLETEINEIENLLNMGINSGRSVRNGTTAIKLHFVRFKTSKTCHCSFACHGHSPTRSLRVLFKTFRSFRPHI